MSTNESAVNVALHGTVRAFKSIVLASQKGRRKYQVYQVLMPQRRLRASM